MYHLIFVVKIKNNMRVCIFGNGLSSLALAKALVNQNIYVDIIFKSKRYKINKTRTIGISKSNVEFFNKHIINIEKIIWKLNKIDIFTENLPQEKLINFEDNSRYLFSIVRNYKLYERLLISLNKNKYFKEIKSKNNINFNNYNLVVNTENNNFITKKYFNKKIEKKYDSYANTTLIKHNKIDNNIATQIFTKKGPIAFLPISNYETSVVYSINRKKIKKNEDIKDLIRHYNFKYKIKKIERIETFELASFSLRSYYYKNILAFGDLLHRIHPLAGQGFNMTVRDIKYLIKIINNRISLGLPLDHSVNYDFEKKLKHKNLIFSSGVDMLYEYFNLESNSHSSLLRRPVNLLNKNYSVKKIITKIADKGLIF